MTVPRIVWIAFSRLSGSAPENSMSRAYMCALLRVGVRAILRRHGMHVDRKLRLPPLDRRRARGRGDDALVPVLPANAESWRLRLQHLFDRAGARRLGRSLGLEDDGVSGPSFHHSSWQMSATSARAMRMSSAVGIRTDSSCDPASTTTDSRRARRSSTMTRSCWLPPTGG